MGINAQDLLARLRAARQPGMSREGVPDLPPPPTEQPVAVMPEPTVDPRVAVIQRLQAEAAMDARPKPAADDGTARKLLFSAIQGLRGAADPQGYAGLQAREAASERQRQQDALARAKGLQGDVNTDREFSADQSREARMAADAAAQRGLSEQTNRRLEDSDVAGQLADQRRLEEEKRWHDMQDATNREKAANAPKGPANLQSKQAILRGGNPNDPVPVNYDTDGTQGPPGRIYDLAGNDISAQVERFFDPVVMPGFNPTTGQPAFTSRQNAVGGGTIPLPPAGTLEKADESKQATANINNLETLYKPEFVGPAAGRWNALKTHLPESLVDLPEGYADFRAASAALKSEVIKAITGAQMNQNEEARILASIPVGENRSDDWEAKYRQLKQRVNTISALKQQRIGVGSYTLEDLDAIAAGRMKPGAPGSAGGGTPPPTSPASPTTTTRKKFNPATGKVE